MKRNIFKKIFDFIFPVEDDSEKIFNLLKNRVIYYPKIRTIYFLPYSNALVRKSILDIKFNKKFRSSTIFAEIIYQNLPDILIDLKIREDFNEPVLVNIPISFLRKISRGYDQNNLIIKQFYALGGKNFINWERENLKKIKNTKPQSKTKNKQERIMNIKDSFSLKNSEKIKDKNILLFDDILTTGATLSEAEKILRKAGAQKIIRMVIAH